MKRIQAIIRASKFDEVKFALYNIGVEFFTYYEVKGASFHAENKGSYRGSSVVEAAALIRKNIEVVVPSMDAQIVIDCIRKHAVTGMAGDGKIYISTVEEAIKLSV